MVEAHDYYPFGLLMPARSYAYAERTKELFIGKELDTETGWYHLDARSYIPAIGRFPNVDPLWEISSGKTPYHYSSNDPVNRIDPDGKFDWGVKLLTFYEVMKAKVSNVANTRVSIGPVDNTVAGMAGEGLQVAAENFDRSIPTSEQVYEFADNLQTTSNAFSIGATLAAGKLALAPGAQPAAGYSLLAAKTGDFISFGAAGVKYAISGSNEDLGSLMVEAAGFATGGAIETAIRSTRLSTQGKHVLESTGRLANDFGKFIASKYLETKKKDEEEKEK